MELEQTETLQRTNSAEYLHLNLILLLILQPKLDSENSTEWQKYSGLSTKLPSFKKCREFLYERFTALKALSTTTKKLVKCPVCKRPHRKYHCNQILRADVDKRREMISSASLRFNRLGPELCKKCETIHHTLLYVEHTSNELQETTSTQRAARLLKIAASHLTIKEIGENNNLRETTTKHLWLFVFPRIGNKTPHGQLNQLIKTINNTDIVHA
uniref:Uncharacterized protein n=1 Tax=Glossina palpalis gambiensis TaxID=67801 RepID=A0A1B0BV35_9MUSC